MTELSQSPQGGLPDKRQVAASFSRAAESYDSVAALQRCVGQQLLRLGLHLVSLKETINTLQSN